MQRISCDGGLENRFGYQVFHLPKLESRTSDPKPQAPKPTPKKKKPQTVIPKPYQVEGDDQAYKPLDWSGSPVSLTPQTPDLRPYTLITEP